MNAIQMSLAALKDGSALVAKVPYISPIAGLLLQTLTMRDEVKQCKVEWGNLMDKLDSVSSIVVDVGESCRTHGLRKENFPKGLRAILETLRSDLREIKNTLRECIKIRGIRRILLRTDMLRKIKQYDSKLSHILQTFQTRLALDSRFALIIQDRKTPTVAKPTDAGRIEMMAKPPRGGFKHARRKLEAQPVGPTGIIVPVPPPGPSRGSLGPPGPPRPIRPIKPVKPIRPTMTTVATMATRHTKCTKVTRVTRVTSVTTGDAA
ncbi:hypothetical protein BJV78DRAFT_1363890 [Lactifluus subvellereus]|nr:hypothetical protein BJV78DRAFT_1363890 [Lactifluus subvellereus]